MSSVASGAAENLSAALLEQEDPELVREATPAYLVFLDSFARDSTSPATLGAAAELYAAYGIVFVDDPQRLQIVLETSIIAHTCIKAILTRMTERRMAEVMSQADCFSQHLVQTECARNGARNLRHLQ